MKPPPLPDTMSPTELLWRFGAADGRIIAAHVKLRPDGTIGGHWHANEAAWRCEGDAIAFLDQAGAPTCVMRPVGGGRYQGEFLGTTTIHILEPTTPAYPFTVQWSAACEKALAIVPIFVQHFTRTEGSFENGQAIRFESPVFAERDSTMPTGQFWSMGAHSYVNKGFIGAATVGRYSCIAQNCGIMGDEHPTTWVTTHHIAYHGHFIGEASRLYGKQYQPVRYDPHPRLPISIGHDVWVGQDVLFKGGIAIGNGAVIAARSVVTKDVAPYSIIGGVPARIIRMRFDDELIERFKRVQWWRFNYPDLPRGWDQPTRFLEDLERRIARSSIEEHRPESVDIGRTLLWASLS